MIQVLVVALYAFTADSALTGHEQAHASAIYKDKKGSLLLSVSSHSHVLYLACITECGTGELSRPCFEYDACSKVCIVPQQLTTEVVPSILC